MLQFCHTFYPHQAIIGLETIFCIFEIGRFTHVLLYMILDFAKACVQVPVAVLINARTKLTVADFLDGFLKSRISVIMSTKNDHGLTLVLSMYIGRIQSVLRLW